MNKSIGWKPKRLLKENNISKREKRECRAQEGPGESPGFGY
jgi:hypothetical protein